MSILVFSVTAALVAADVPTSISSEVVEKLDLRGTWGGTASNTQPITRIKISTGGIDLQSDGGRVGCPCNVVDEGEGKFRIELMIFGKPRGNLLGIYQRRGDDLLICIQGEKGGRPTSFRDDGVNSMFLLRRLTAGK